MIWLSKIRCPSHNTPAKRGRYDQLFGLCHFGSFIGILCSLRDQTVYRTSFQLLIFAGRSVAPLFCFVSSIWCDAEVDDKYLKYLKPVPGNPIEIHFLPFGEIPTRNPGNPQLQPSPPVEILAFTPPNKRSLLYHRQAILKF